MSHLITIAVGNRKGGCGKTTLCHHLGLYLAELGHDVLFIDQDPQASLTRGLIGQAETDALPAALTTAAIAGASDSDPLALIREVAPRVGLVPGSGALAEFDLSSPFRPEVSRRRLRAFLAEAAQEHPWRFALIDCPPILQACTASAFAAAEAVLVPTMLDQYSAQGLPPVFDLIEQSRDVDNPCLRVAGIVLMRRKHRGNHPLLVEGAIRKQYGDQVFDREVPDHVAYEEAIGLGKSITMHDPNSNAAKAIRALAVEFLTRVGADLP